jgi:hypothetical protein
MMDDREIRLFSVQILSALLAKDVGKLKVLAPEIRGGLEMYFAEIAVYPQTLVAPSADAEDLFWIIELPREQSWSVDAFFALESGENSDLDVRMTVRRESETLVADIRDILVP